MSDRPTPSSSPDPRAAAFGFDLALAVLLATAVGLALLSRIVDDSLWWSLGWRVGLNAAGGLALLGLAWALLRGRAAAGRSAIFSDRRGLLVILCIGLAMRGAMFLAVPMQEDDYHRYLWDGAVTAAGLDPYRIAPNDIATDLDRTELAADPDGRRTLEQVNHRYLRTIYPPLAQAAFAAAHWLTPWDVTGLRLVFLAFDLLALVAVVGLLAAVGLPREWAALYWCNPLLVFQVFGQVHMDVLPAALAAAAVWLAVRHRRVVAMLLLALATAAKLWPIALLPLLLRNELSRPRRLLGLLAMYGLAGAALLAPMAGAFGEKSGLTAYSRSWDNNDALFQLILWGWQSVDGWLPGPMHDGRMARLTVAVLLAGVLGWLCRRPMTDGRDLVGRALLLLAALFLLSPTQLPWYYVWLLPLLAVTPRWPLLAYPALLALYPLHYAWPAVVWIEHGPIVAWLGWAHWSGRRRRTAAAPEEVAPA